MAKYLKALDHLSIAAQFLKAGKPVSAAKHMTAAIKSPSFATAVALIDKFNDRQVAAIKLEQAAKAKKVVKKGKKKAKANSWPFPVQADANEDVFQTDDNEEYGEEVEENKGLREVQEADATEGDEEDLDLDDVETEESSTEEEEEVEEEETPEEEDVEQARFIRALHNARAQKATVAKTSTAASRVAAPAKK
jgi:cobalamin biosynthesis protein CobT